MHRPLAVPISCLHLNRLTVFGWLPLTSAGCRCGAPVSHRLRGRVRWASSIHLGVTEQDVAADGVCYHRGSGVVRGLKIVSVFFFKTPYLFVIDTMIRLIPKKISTTTH